MVAVADNEVVQATPGEQTSLRLLQQLREDYQVHQKDWTLPGFRAVAVYRFGVWASGLRPRILRAPFTLIYNALYRYVRNHYSIELPRSAKVGRRLWIAHQGGIVIHWLAEIGDDCVLRQNVTLGAAAEETMLLAPILRNRVQVGCGAAIIGRVEIGDDVRIGANAVVTRSVPSGSTVVAPAPMVIPAKRNWDYSI